MELQQALLLTVIGMGMTFAAIGLLVAVMYAMTALIKDKTDVEDVDTDDIDLPIAVAPWENSSNDIAPLAAAAAVATMFAEQQGKAQAAAAAVTVALTTQTIATPAFTTRPNAWNTTIRAQRLAQRQYHNLRRRH